jgi:hypothetical protein
MEAYYLRDICKAISDRIVDKGVRMNKLSDAWHASEVLPDDSDITLCKISPPPIISPIWIIAYRSRTNFWSGKKVFHYNSPSVHSLTRRTELGLLLLVSALCFHRQ